MEDITIRFKARQWQPLLMVPVQELEHSEEYKENLKDLDLAVEVEVGFSLARHWFSRPK